MGAGQVKRLSPLTLHASYHPAALAAIDLLARCDRSYGADCALWQHIGEVLLAGPINALAPS